MNRWEKAQWNAVNKWRAKYIAKYRKRFKRELDAQIAPVMELIKISSRPEDVASGIRSVMRHDNIIGTFNDLYKEVGVEAARWERDRLVKEEKAYKPNLITKADTLPQFEYIWMEGMANYLTQQTATYITSIINTSNNIAIRLVQLTIAQGIDKGMNLTQIMKLLEDRIPVNWRKVGVWRSELIARTEIITAQNYGAALGARTTAQELGLTLNKRWLAKVDSRTREPHIDANGQEVALDEKFSVGGTLMAQPGDPAGGADNRCNCRCSVVHVRADGQASFSGR